MTSNNEIDSFMEDIEVNMKAINTHIDLLSSELSREFTINLCEFYAIKEYLTRKQVACLVPILHEINEELEDMKEGE